MNCKPGDIAMVITGPYYGTVVEIIEAPPIGVDFRLPNGRLHVPCPPGRWVVNSDSGLLKTRCGRWVMTGVARDDMLMPIGDVKNIPLLTEDMIVQTP